MEVPKTFNWVAARAKCTAETMGSRLVQAIRQDVEEANAIAPYGRTFDVIYQADLETPRMQARARTAAQAMWAKKRAAAKAKKKD